MSIIDAMNKLSKALYNYNPARLDIRTGLYIANSGKFLTRAEANESRWFCEKCNRGFSTKLMFRTHRDEIHSY